MSDILTDWHRECIERGATLLVLPFERQPGKDTTHLVQSPFRERKNLWIESWTNDMVRNFPGHEHICPVAPGDVMEVHPRCPTQSCELERSCEYSGECEASEIVLCRLRCTDVACKRLLDMTYEERLAATRIPSWEPSSTEGRQKLKSDMMFVIDKCIRKSRPEFPADGYVWLVSVEKEGE